MLIFKEKNIYKNKWNLYLSKWIDQFIDKTIHQNEDCYTWKTFISHEVLWISINNQGLTEYYIIAEWQWFFLDNRQNLQSSCKFTGTPIAITIKEYSNWYQVVKYRKWDNWPNTDSVLKERFSSNAYDKRKNKTYYNSQKSTSSDFLSMAEKYFYRNTNEDNNFECNFCDKKRYFYDKITNKNWEILDLYGLEPADKKFILFHSNNNIEITDSNWKILDWNRTRHFGKDNKTIVINNEEHPNIIERFIIDEFKNNEITFFNEIIQL